jgi:hypothetical protein
LQRLQHSVAAKERLGTTFKNNNLILKALKMSSRKRMTLFINVIGRHLADDNQPTASVAP